MTQIELHTVIKAPQQTVFDLSRSIDFHCQSASRTHEKAIAGVTSGLIKKGESVTWRGKHFGFYLKHSSKIIEMTPPVSFTDVMTQGHFTYFVHQHLFRKTTGGVEMVDKLQYKVPHGWLGKLFDKWILKKHLTRFLEHRNKQIKRASENTMAFRTEL